MMISNDDGLLKLTVNFNGQEHSAMVDVFEANDHLYWMQTGETQEQIDKFWEATAAWSEKIGLPHGLTRYTLSKLRSAVFERMAELAKKDRTPEQSGTPD